MDIVPSHVKSIEIEVEIAANPQYLTNVERKILTAGDSLPSIIVGSCPYPGHDATFELDLDQLIPDLNEKKDRKPLLFRGSCTEETDGPGKRCNGHAYGFARMKYF